MRFFNFPNLSSRRRSTATNPDSLKTTDLSSNTNKINTENEILYKNSGKLTMPKKIPYQQHQENSSTQLETISNLNKLFSAKRPVAYVNIDKDTDHPDLETRRPLEEINPNDVILLKKHKSIINNFITDDSNLSNKISIKL